MHRQKTVKPGTIQRENKVRFQQRRPGGHLAIPWSAVTMDIARALSRNAGEAAAAVDGVLRVAINKRADGVGEQNSGFVLGLKSLAISRLGRVAEWFKAP